MVVALAFGIGQCSAKQGTGHEHESKSSAPKVVTPAPTHTVVRSETVVRESMPKSCSEALELAREIDSNAGPLIAVYDKALDVMGDAHEAMTMSDGSRLNRLRTQLYQLNSNTTKSAMQLKVDVVPEFNRRMRACIKTDAGKLP